MQRLRSHKLLKWSLIASLFGLGIISCASKDDELFNKTVIKKTHNYRPLWFKTDEKYSFLNDERETVFHPFFDLLPSADMTEKTINYFPVTPKESKYYYEIDLVSGKRYMSHPICEGPDVWRGYEGSISNPPYERGVIPRVLDQIGKPQEIIVFGKSSKKKKNKLSNILNKKALIEEVEKPFKRAKNYWWGY